MTSDNKILLGVLDAIERSDRVTQRGIAQELGVALGLVNVYLKRCVKKGLVKVTEAPARRYAYYLTPSGFSEKARLTGEYLYNSFHFFRLSRSQYGALLAECRAKGWERVAMAGTGDLAEVVVLCATESGFALTGVLGDGGGLFHGLKVAPRLADLAPVDAVILADFRQAPALHRRLLDELPAERILVPELLRVSLPAEVPA